MGQPTLRDNVFLRSSVAWTARVQFSTMMMAGWLEPFEAVEHHRKASMLATSLGERDDVLSSPAIGRATPVKQPDARSSSTAQLLDEANTVSAVGTFWLQKKSREEVGSLGQCMRPAVSDFFLVLHIKDDSGNVPCDCLDRDNGL